MYFGKMTDTVTIQHDIYPMSSVNFTLDLENESMRELEKGEFDNYYFSWSRLRQYKSCDSVKLDIRIDTSQIITNKGRAAYPVIIKNLHSDTNYVGYGQHIPIITEALNENGEWMPIEYQFTYQCGNGVNYMILPPKHVVITSELIYSGPFRTKLRIKFGINYSREFSGSINKSQFEYQWETYTE